MGTVKKGTAPQKLERELREQGYHLVGGIDEAGRGPLAGPVCAAVVIFDGDVRIPGVNDSKQLDAEERERLYHKIMAKALAVGVGLACAEEIDQLNILRATHLAARRALRQLRVMPDYLLLDALRLDKVTVPQMSLTKGDSKSFSIAAASIVAKVTRDRLMSRCEEEFPGYGFGQHKGYATPHHRKAIADLGRSSLHRHTFLESWFDPGPPLYSKSYQKHRERLAVCEAAELIHQVLAEIREHRDWLPIEEWNQLSKFADQRCRELNDKLINL